MTKPRQHHKCLRVAHLLGGFQSQWISFKYLLRMTVKRSLNLLWCSKDFLCCKVGERVEVEKGDVKFLSEFDQQMLTASDLIPTGSSLSTNGNFLVAQLKLLEEQREYSNWKMKTIESLAAADVELVRIFYCHD